MELYEYFDVLWCRKWVILVTLVATVGIVGVGTYYSTPVYVATAIVRIAPGSGAYFDYADYLYGERLRNTYSEVATTGPVLEQVRLRLHLTEPPRTEQIRVSVIEDTELIRLRVEDPDPSFAAEVANALAEVLITEDSLLSDESVTSSEAVLGEELDRVEKELLQMQAKYDELLVQAPSDLEQIGNLARSIRLKQDVQAMLFERYEQGRIDNLISGNVISLIDSATTPTVPVRPRTLVNIVGATVVGLMGGLFLAFLFENLDAGRTSEEEA
jgi:capsular polysaccharide biosynthesis protein